ncbi:prepilin peptidase [Brevibacillus ginsengisoli]|uniref:prepilin peptidase n=1 Tax=Brevibacillus ginsengisoli TaxID=363854 RepID=UPI003CEBCD39
MPPLDIFFYPFFFILGLMFGSFYNVVGLRIPKKESIISPPSHCPHCNRQLNSLDLIPLIGFLARKGKCASCKEPIAVLYVLIEAFTGFLFLLSYHQLKGDWLELIVALLFISMCVIVTVSDLAYTLIPNKVLLFFLPLLFIARVLSHPLPLTEYAIGAIAGFGVFFLVAVMKPGAMGMGDVKLFALIGWIIGWQLILIALFFASLMGLIAGLNLIRKGKATMKAAIPFGPFLSAGSILAYFWGAKLLESYFSLFY